MWGLDFVFIGFFSVSCLCVVLGVLVLGLSRQQRQLRDMYLRDQKQQQMISSASIGMGQKILDLEKRLRELAERQAHVETREIDMSFSRAHALIEQGLSREAIAANSGLSLSEIQLMEMLHQESHKPKVVAETV